MCVHVPWHTGAVHELQVGVTRDDGQVFLGDGGRRVVWLAVRLQQIDEDLQRRLPPIRLSQQDHGCTERHTPHWEHGSTGRSNGAPDRTTAIQSDKWHTDGTARPAGATALRTGPPLYRAPHATLRTRPDQQGQRRSEQDHRYTERHTPHWEHGPTSRGNGAPNKTTAIQSDKWHIEDTARPAGATALRTGPLLYRATHATLRTRPDQQGQRRSEQDHRYTERQMAHWGHGPTGRGNGAPNRTTAIQSDTRHTENTARPAGATALPTGPPLYRATHATLRTRPNQQGQRRSEQDHRYTERHTPHWKHGPTSRGNGAPNRTTAIQSDKWHIEGTARPAGATALRTGPLLYRAPHATLRTRPDQQGQRRSEQDHCYTERHTPHWEHGPTSRGNGAPNRTTAIQSDTRHTENTARPAGATALPTGPPLYRAPHATLRTRPDQQGQRRSEQDHRYTERQMAHWGHGPTSRGNDAPNRTTAIQSDTRHTENTARPAGATALRTGPPLYRATNGTLRARPDRQGQRRSEQDHCYTERHTPHWEHGPTSRGNGAPNRTTAIQSDTRHTENTARPAGATALPTGPPLYRAPHATLRTRPDQQGQRRSQQDHRYTERHTPHWEHGPTSRGNGAPNRTTAIQSDKWHTEGTARPAGATTLRTGPLLYRATHATLRTRPDQQGQRRSEQDHRYTERQMAHWGHGPTSRGNDAPNITTRYIEAGNTCTE